jgi:hypothetical protein
VCLLEARHDVMLLDEGGTSACFMMKERHQRLVRAPMSHGGRRRCISIANGVDASVHSDGGEYSGIRMQEFSWLQVA